MKLTVSATFALLLAALAPALADAQAARAVLTSGAWQGFASDAKTGKVCYAVAWPVKSANAPKGRARPYVAVTDRPAEKSVGVVSFNAGFPYKKASTATLEIGTAKFDLYTDGSTAWSRDDKAVVTAMGKAKGMILHSSPASGPEVADDFSLEGFGKVVDAVAKACAAK